MGPEAFLRPLSSRVYSSAILPFFISFSKITNFIPSHSVVVGHLVPGEAASRLRYFLVVASVRACATTVGTGYIVFFVVAFCLLTFGLVS